jgi:hypothetical protein
LTPCRRRAQRRADCKLAVVDVRIRSDGARLPDAEILSTDAAAGVHVVYEKRREQAKSWLDGDKKRRDGDKGRHVPGDVDHWLFKRPLLRDVEQHFASNLRHLVSTGRHDLPILTTERRIKTTLLSTVLHEGSIGRVDPDIVLRYRDPIVDS